MYEITRQDLSNLKISTRMIASELLDRGYKIETFSSSSAVLQVHLPDNPIPMRIFSVIDESMSFIAGRSIAGNKQVTNALLKSVDIPVPEEIYIELQDLDNRRDEIIDFINQHGRVVVKPIDGAHGRGVYTNVSSYDKVAEYGRGIIELSLYSGFVLQQQLGGMDIRVVCIDGKFASAMTRVPAFVIGDGEHDVTDLIEQENSGSQRGMEYESLLNKIDMSYVNNYLSEEDLKRVPEFGERVQVIGISNVGVGGTRENLDDDIPQFLIDLSERVSTELRLPVCGVDFFVSNIPNRNSTFEELNPFILEVNNCPGLTMYDSFDNPKQKELVRKLVDSQIAAHYKLYPR